MEKFDSENVKNAHNITNAAFQCLNTVHHFMEDRYSNIWGVISSPITERRDDCLKGLWMRAFAWIKSLSMIEHISGWQAFATGNRALLELAIDMIFLSYDKTNETGEKLYWWGQSEKLKNAELFIKYCVDHDLTNSQRFNQFVIFVDLNKSQIEQKRQFYWKMQKHPNTRWTKNDLANDAKKADEIYLNDLKTKIGMGLEQYYETEYRRINWFIHSGVSSFWDNSAEVFEAQNFTFLRYSAKFGILCTYIIQKDFGISRHWDDFDDIFKNIEDVQNDLLINAFENNFQIKM